MYRIGICDDGVGICSSMENMIQKYIREHGLSAETGIWYSGEKLCEYLGQGGFLDILFLDIELMELSGIEVGNYIRNRMGDRGMQIVYISGKASYALELFKTQPLDFLVKPITQIQVNEVLELGIKILDKNEEKFGFHIGRDYYALSYGEILYSPVREGRLRYIKQERNAYWNFMEKLQNWKKSCRKNFKEYTSPA